MILILILLLMLLIIFLSYKKVVEYKSFFNFCLKFLSILIILECTLFNFRFFESRNYKEIKMDDFVVGDGITKLADGTLMVTGDKLNYIEYKGINAHLDNIYLDFGTQKDNDYKVLKVAVGYTDDANERYSYAQERNVEANNGDNGEYLKLHLVGKTKKVRIYIKTTDKLSKFRVKQISFNKPVPFDFNLLRIFIIFMLGVICYIFRPKSILYKKNLFDDDSKFYLFVAIWIQIFFFLVVSLFNQYFVREEFLEQDRYQYRLLTEAIMEGKPYLLETPSEILKNLKNPYDTKARKEAFKNSTETYLWDVAYYNNHYYVYFGIAPVIFYYLPYYALTHTHISTWFCNVITMVITSVGILLLLYHICKKYYKDISVGSFLAIMLTFINSCGLFAIMGRPDHYSLPIIMAVMFSIFGLYFWLKAKDKEMDTKYIMLGSICMALVAACRPQLLLTSFFVFPIFWDEIKTKKLFSKDNIKKILAFVLPYIIIAIFLMWYNYIRFASPFDFGANYNLTTNDMTKRGFVFGRIGLGLFYFLIGPISYSLKFPFIHRNYVSTNYMGTTIFEDMYPGFLLMNLLTIFGLLIFKYRKKIKKPLYQIGVISVISTFIIIIVDTQMAGILPRYICDFGFLLYIASSIVVFYLLSTLKGDKKKWLTYLIYICFIISIIVNFLLIFSDDMLSKSQIYFYFRKILEFWV